MRQRFRFEYSSGQPVAIGDVVRVHRLLRRPCTGIVTTVYNPELPSIPNGDNEFGFNVKISEREYLWCGHRNRALELVTRLTAGAPSSRSYTLLPRKQASAALQQQIGSILDLIEISRVLPRARELFIWIEGAIPEGTTLDQAHVTWSPARVGGLQHVSELPFRDVSEEVPQNIYRLSAECIKRRSGGMSSYFGFEGFFASLLLHLTSRSVWDARGESAS